MYAIAKPKTHPGEPAPVSAETWSTLINLAGRQRMLSQRIVLMAVLHERGDPAARAAAGDALAQFRSAHQRLAHGGDGLPAPSPAVREAMHGGGAWGPQGLDADVQAFVDLADQALRTDAAPARTALATAGAPGALAKLVERATPMLAALNRLTQIYEALAHENAARQKQRQSELIGRIESIAREARIISMNARVAAARAGESGREFGVVAARLVEVSAQMEATSREALR